MSRISAMRSGSVQEQEEGICLPRVSVILSPLSEWKHKGLLCKRNKACLQSRLRIQIKIYFGLSKTVSPYRVTTLCSSSITTPKKQGRTPGQAQLPARGMPGEAFASLQDSLPAGSELGSLWHTGEI